MSDNIHDIKEARARRAQRILQLLGEEGGVLLRDGASALQNYRACVEDGVQFARRTLLARFQEIIRMSGQQAEATNFGDLEDILQDEDALRTMIDAFFTVTADRHDRDTTASFLVVPIDGDPPDDTHRREVQTIIDHGGVPGDEVDEGASPTEALAPLRRHFMAMKRPAVVGWMDESVVIAWGTLTEEGADPSGLS
jgi:hypothetical protein